MEATIKINLYKGWGGELKISKEAAEKIRATEKDGFTELQLNRITYRFWSDGFVDAKIHGKGFRGIGNYTLCL